MKELKLQLLFLILLCSLNVSLSGQESQLTVNITSLEELKTGIHSASFQEVLMSMDFWLPKLVSSVNWQTQMSQRYLLNYYIDVQDEDDALFDSFLNESDEIYNQLVDFFHIEATSKQDSLALKTRLLCFIIKTRTERTFGSMIDPHTLFFFLDPKKTPNYMEKFRHEYAHWVWGRMYGEAPSLFWEGVATYAEKMSQPEADISVFFDIKLDLEKIPPLQEVAINENFWKYNGMYTVGSLLVYFLVEKWGWEPLKRLFLLSDYEDPDILEHFNQIYGKSLETVNLEWREFIKAEVKTKE